MSTAPHAMNNLGPKLNRAKLFLVNFVLNATGEETPVSEKPLFYEEAMAEKEKAEKSGKYDLKKGYFAAMRLTEDQQDRYEEKQKRQVSSEPTPAAAPVAPKAKKDGAAPEE
jgi:hypothetical protein